MPEYRITVSVDQEAKAKSKIGKEFNFKCFSKALKLKHKEKGQEVEGRIVPTTAGDKGKPFFVANTVEPSVDLMMKVVEGQEVWKDENDNPVPMIVELAPATTGHEPDAATAIKSLKEILAKPPIDRTMEVTVTEKRSPNPPKKSKKPPKTATLRFTFHFELSKIYVEDKAVIRLRGREFELKVNRALDALIPTLGDRTIDRAAACQLLMSTANHETKFISRNQGDGGPAKAIIQMEPDTYDHLWKDRGYLSTHPLVAEAVCRLAGVGGSSKPDIALLSSNDTFAAGMAFVRYLDNEAGTKERPLPGVDEIWEQSRYWGRWYQGEFTKEKMDSYFNAWHRVFGSDSQDAPIPEIVPTPGDVPAPEAQKGPEGSEKKVLDRTVGL